MATLRSIILKLGLLIFYACGGFVPIGTLDTADQQPVAKQDTCKAVDYYGNATWRLTADSLLLNLKGDFIGKLVATDSNKTITALLTGKFIAPLGDDKFTRIGSMTLTGKLVETDDRQLDILLHVVSGTGGFKNITGYLYLNWLLTDDEIWYGGTFCF